MSLAIEGTDSVVRSGYQLRTTDLTKQYVTPGGVTVNALQGVALDVDSSSVIALVGPSGSGKSTLLHLVGGMDRPGRGQIHVDDQDITRLSQGDLVRYRRTVGFVFQNFALLPAMTARDNVLLPTIPYRDTRGWRHQRADQLLRDVGLRDRGDSLPSQLSGGERQRVAIARALINQPRLLLADEPTGNLDRATGDAIADQILRLREQHGVTVILATHDPDIAGRCDKVVHLLDGRIVGERV
ncbi:ABC transporter ATP-binding protein [Nocardioides hungaricus]